MSIGNYRKLDLNIEMASPFSDRLFQMPCLMNLLEEKSFKLRCHLIMVLHHLTINLRTCLLSPVSNLQKYTPEHSFASSQFRCTR